ncbi:MAG: glycosyltransferase family 61 protein [Coleofasciculus sp. D1-CHI-01]|uniref:glycosyltransferase family 61 protein n=1 Tax=Coleofasciculus sp. D1-CHI-01 TaxID=3068482 RepID=UPI0032FA46A3
MHESLKIRLRAYWYKLNKPIAKILVNFLLKLPERSKLFGLPQGFYEVTEDWINDSGLNKVKLQENYKKIHFPHQIVRTEPGRLDKKAHWKFKQEYQRESPETFVVKIPNGRVLGQGGTIITPDDKVLADLSRIYSQSINDHPIFCQWKFPKLQCIDGTVAVLSAIAGEGYFHWMCDVLPRIELLRLNNIDLNTIDNFLVNLYQAPFHKETLKTLGIHQSKIIESVKFPHIKATQLVVPSLPGISGNIPKWACDFLRNTFLSGNQTKISDLPERIYISRTRTNNRKIINEAELVKFLIPYKFKTIFLESMSVAEQALLFSRAKFILAPHGAGLTNLVFCNSGTKVIEIFSPFYVNVCYYSLSNQVNLDYYYLLGEGKRPPEYVDPGLGRANILVNLDSLSNLFKLVGI